MVGVDGSTCDDDTVGDTGDAQGHLVVLVVEEFLGEELFGFEPSTSYIRWEVRSQSSQALSMCGSWRNCPREVCTMVASEIGS